jgi:succinoglycan biosynthesis protein ExoA
MSYSFKISIVVPCRNENGHIRRFLDSLLAQDLDGIRWEAIIADGMSNDGTREIIDEYCRRDPRLRTVDNPERIASTGLNRAILAARGEIIIRMDAHTWYARDYCARCVEVLERTGADNAGGPARTVARGTLARAIAAAFHSPFSTGGARFHDENYEGWVDTVPYGCWRRDTLLQLGLFDEKLVRSQDDELNLRLIRRGGRIWQSPAIVSWYSPRSTLTSLFRQYFQYGFWKVAVIRKHRIPASWRHLVPAAFVLANIVPGSATLMAAIAGAANWRDLAGLAWAAVLAPYGVFTVAASIAAARRSGFALLPCLPAVFATYHVSYGLGSLAGIFQKNVTGDSIFVRLTR